MRKIAQTHLDDIDPPTEEDIERWAQALSSIAWTSENMGRALQAFAVQLAEVMQSEEWGWSDHTHGMTLEELLGDDVTELIRVNRIWP